jgi:hypothetical protein
VMRGEDEWMDRVRAWEAIGRCKDGEAGAGCLNEGEYRPRQFPPIPSTKDGVTWLGGDASMTQ